MKICSIEGCKEKHYSAGYCRKHWQKFIYYPNHKECFKRSRHKYWLKINNGLSRVKCKIENCNNTCLRNNKYCVGHRNRIKRNLPLDLSINCKGMHAPKGLSNFRWNGGVSEYKDHYKMKLMRKQKIKETGGKCEHCGKHKKNMHLHHIDGNKSHHELSNFLFLCLKCHYKIHAGRKNGTSKFIRKYGLSVKDISNKTFLSTNQIRLLDRRENLYFLLESINTK